MDKEYLAAIIAEIKQQARDPGFFLHQEDRDEAYVRNLFYAVLHQHITPEILKPILLSFKKGDINAYNLIKHFMLQLEKFRVDQPAAYRRLACDYRRFLPGKLTVEPAPGDAVARFAPPGPGRLAYKQRYQVKEFLQYRDEAFVANAFRGVFHREPSIPEIDTYLQPLRQCRLNEMDILQILLTSAEGRNKGVAVDGLAWYARMNRLGKVRFLGYALRWLKALLYLPRALQALARRRDSQVTALRHMQEHMHANQRFLWSLYHQYQDMSTKMTDLVDMVQHKVDESVAGNIMEVVRRKADGTETDSLVNNLKHHYQVVLKEMNEDLESMAGQLRNTTLAIKELCHAPADSAPHAREDAPRARSAQVQQPLDLEQMYANFEDRFRGSRVDIKQRLVRYLELIASTGFSSQKILDLGCGRGEWLELLQEKGLQGQGVDANSLFVRACRERGLSVHHGDILNYLAEQPQDTYSAITSFQVIEHLPFNSLLCLLDRALRVLRPGGILLLETPNPENLQVGAFTFYKDPSHHQPYAPDFMAFAMEQRGYERIAVQRINAPHNPPESPVLKKWLFTGMDYAIMGYKP